MDPSERRPNKWWTETDTFAMLALIEELDLVHELDKKRQRNDSHFRRLRHGLAGRGIHFTVNQIRNRWKSLKHKYRKIKTAGYRSPAARLSAIEAFRYFRRLDRMLAARRPRGGGGAGAGPEEAPGGHGNAGVLSTSDLDDHTDSDAPQSCAAAHWQDVPGPEGDSEESKGAADEAGDFRTPRWDVGTEEVVTLGLSGEYLYPVKAEPHLLSSLRGLEGAREPPGCSPRDSPVFTRRMDWAICLRSGLPTRGNNTNNFVESAMRVLKDNVFYRLKAYNIAQLVDFIYTRLEAYYVRRLLDVANKRTAKVESKNKGVVSPDRIIKEDETNYTVTSESGAVYLVNMSVGMCTCPAGSSGALCKHQHAVMQVFNLQGSLILPGISSTIRKSFYEIATGKCDVPDNWFMGLEFERQKDFEETPLNASIQEQTVPPSGQGSAPEQAEASKRARQKNYLEDRLKMMFDGLMDKLRQDDTFHAPTQSLVSSYEKIATDSGLISALSTFGKARSATANSLKVRPRSGLQTSTQIGVQPTAVARRKTPLGGRRALITGRPPKRARREHNYGKVKEGSGGLPKRSAPHSLSQCVSEGVSLGGQHSKK